MSFLKDLKELKKDVAEIKAVLSGNLQKDSEELKEIKKNLSFVNLRVKNISDTIDLNGQPALKVTYEAPQVILTFDDNGNVMENNVFKAINVLDLLKIDDQIALVQAINQKSLK